MRRLIAVMVCLFLIAGLTITTAATDFTIDVGQTWDNSILAGGIFDMYAWVGENPEDYTFQWQVDLGFGKGHWSDLEDNADPYGYSGTDTYHLQFITPRTNGYIIGTGWEDIPFRCLITHKKTGVSVGTADIFMHVFTSDDLPEYLAKQGFGLYEPTLNGTTGLRTTDYTSYSASAFAGKPLEIFCGCWLPGSEHLLRQSDFTENIEIWITENGKTVKVGDSTTYTPYTIGKNAVTVQFKLHHALGIHDLGYYESKTVNITTREPTVVDYGTAKYQISLLKERYNESQKLTSIPKGAEFKVTEKSANWYQIVYNGYVGYVAPSAVTLWNTSPVIDHVNVKIAEPLAGNIPPTSCSVTPDTCFVTSVEWLDKTADRFMKSGERFQKGHTYQLVIWASAKEGYQFKLDPQDKMLTTATINGNLPAFTSRAYEQIIGKVIDIRFDFVNVKESDTSHTCDPILVPRVEPTCTQSGFEAYYHCGCGTNYSDPQGTKVVDIRTWGKIPPLGHLETAYQSDPYMHYKICGRTTCGEDLSEYRGNHSGGNATCQQYAVCTVCGKEYGQTADHKWSQNPEYQEKEGHAYICEYPLCTAHDKLSPHIPGPEATQTEPQKCKVCQYILVPAGNHKHNLTQVEAVAATCQTPGRQAYYTCDGCEEWFWDHSGKEPIPHRNDVLLEVLGHLAKQWQSDEESHWQICTVCSKEFGNGNHCDEDVNQVCDTCGNAISHPDTPTSPVNENDAEGNGQNNARHIWILISVLAVAALLCFTFLGITVLLVVTNRKKE